MPAALILLSKRIQANSQICRLIFFLKLFVFFTKTLDTAFGIKELLFAGEKRMAFGTNFNADIFFGGSGFQYIAAGALYLGLMVLGMNIGFHFSVFLLGAVSRQFFLCSSLAVSPLYNQGKGYMGEAH
jgi:hypothetical protein